MHKAIALLPSGSWLDTVLSVLHDCLPLICWLVLWGLVYVAYAKRDA